MSRAAFINTIIQRGYKKGQTQFEKRRVVFFNIIMVFIILADLAMIFLAHSLNSKILNAVGLVLFIALYYIHKFKPTFGILLFGIIYQIFIFAHSSILDIGGHVEYGALAMTIVLPIFYKKKAALYFLVSNLIIFYYPYIFLDAYESFFKLSYVFAIGLFFAVRAFVIESEKYEKALIKKQMELIALNKEKNHLIQVVAHDLKSPLHQVEGLISLLQLSKENESQKKEYMFKIISSVRHMGNMILRILDIEKIEKRKTIDLSPTDAGEILEKVIDEFQILAKHKDIQIRPSLLGNVWIEGDAHYLEQVFNNLLSNAIKFSPKGKTIYINTEKTESSVIIKITDEGPGISKKDQTKLYLKFQKLSAQPTDNEDSTGLGLALTKSFVDAMKGTIRCDSELNNGATFTVEFSKSNPPE